MDASRFNWTIVKVCSAPSAGMVIRPGTLYVALTFPLEVTDDPICGIPLGLNESVNVMSSSLSNVIIDFLREMGPALRLAPNSMDCIGGGLGL